MYVSSTSLPALLPPAAYSSADQYEVEVQQLLYPSWHVAASWKQLARPGDFVTLTLLDQPLQIRNFDGELRVLSNVCAHRHCLLTHASSGNTPAMRCQYHGWEYGEDGRTRAIPAPKNFMPLDRDLHRLPNYRVERCGQLVFVSLDPRGASLHQQLGDLYEVCEKHFGDGWQESMSWDPDYEVNWKIPIENSLEAYHVPCIHPQTFREDPGSQRSEHVLREHRTAFGTTLPFSPHSRLDRLFQSGEGWLMRRLGIVPTATYWQHHVFPNLLFSFTDAISLCHCVVPTGPQRSRAIIRQFGRSSSANSWFAQRVATGWGRVAAAITRQIVKEDIHLFQDIQLGLNASRQRGILGACEERIHSFHQFVAEACSKHDGGAAAPRSACEYPLHAEQPR